MLDQGQTAITRPKTPTVPLTNHSPERFVPRTYTKAEATLLESMMIRLIPTDPRSRPNIDGCNLPRSQHNAGAYDRRTFVDGHTLQGRVHSLMKDAKPRTAEQVGKALGISTTSAGNALCNLAARYGVVQRIKRENRVNTWQATQ